MSGRAHPAKRSIIVLSASLLSLTVLWRPAWVGQAAVDAARVRPHDVTSALIATPGNPNRPLLAFYYMGYARTSWSARTMSDLPAIPYDSGDDVAISRQITWAANAGITGFIGSWWGPDSQTDRNFSRLLARSALLEKTAGYHFASTIYLESDAPALTGSGALAGALRYVLTRYGTSRYFFHWHGKPVIFIWDPLDHGRTLAQWAAIRRQVDPHHRTLWSAEGATVGLLAVFDGLHLFSAGYWGILHGDMAAVDQGFRAKVDAYNRAHHAAKLWAAGVQPGYNDTRIRPRPVGYVVPRRGGATYRTSWQAALASHPDWITISTFNEWYEGGMIEPSVSYAGFYLRLTRRYARAWHG
jgi:Glycosyl hydrolase family 99